MLTPSLRASCVLSALTLLLAMPGAVQAQTPIDQYGGMMPGAAPPTGYFQVKQVGDRWLFVTPDGNGLWMTGTFGVTYAEAVDDFGTSTVDRIAAKYGGGSGWFNNWRINTARRLKAWGFNTLAEYQHWGMRPGALYDPNPEKLPYIHIIKPAAYGLDNRYGCAPGPFKDLIVGTDQNYDGYRGGQSPDFFDPNFEAYVDGWMKRDDGLIYGDNGNPWLLGIAMDDTDNLLGFGPGPEIPAPRLHPHLGWIALVTNFQQTSSPWVTSYADRKVYTKYALRDFLLGRYVTIAALNAAWGSTYTSFDSAGGWGAGTGLLDENGRHAWVGRWNDEMATATAALRTDLNDFLYQYAKRYFSVMAAKMRQYAPHHLVFGPASLNGWAGLTRKEILRAAGESVDVLQAAIGSPQALELTTKYAGNKPIVTWDSFVANPDSAVWRYPNPEDGAGGTRLASQQEERGQLYANKVDFLFNATSSAGVHPVAGIKLWSWTDNWWEKANFGLVSFSDNAYDGRQAVRATGNDPWGWPTGREEGDYGDFLTPVAAANAKVMRALAAGSGGLAGQTPALFNPSQGTVSLIASSQDLPPANAYTNYYASAPVRGQWVMGDWDGDGKDTPAVYGDNGAFYYTNDSSQTTRWTGIWFGFLGRAPIAGHFDVAAGHDCLGVVDSAPWPGYGTAFAVYFTCALTSGPNPPKGVQWLGPILPDAAGFTGVQQFAAGDFNGDGVDTVAIRRGSYVTWTNVAPTTLMSQFSLAQYIGSPAAGSGSLVAGDWDGNGLDSFGLFYPDGSMYRRNDLDWNSGAYSLQRVGQPLGTPVTAATWSGVR